MEGESLNDLSESGVDFVRVAITMCCCSVVIALLLFWWRRRRHSETTECSPVVDNVTAQKLLALPAPEPTPQPSSPNETTEATNVPSDSTASADVSPQQASTEASDGQRLLTAKIYSLYQQGTRLEAAGEEREALECYMACVYGCNLNAAALSVFPDVVDCIDRIQRIYKSHGNYVQAARFLHAKKLVYEDVLCKLAIKSVRPFTPASNQRQSESPLNSADNKDNVNTHQSTDDAESKDANYVTSPRSPTIRERLANDAKAYSMLSEMFFKEKNYTLALEYASKALQAQRTLNGSYSNAAMTQTEKQLLDIVSALSTQQPSQAAETSSLTSDTAETITNRKAPFTTIVKQGQTLMKKRSHR